MTDEQLENLEEFTLDEDYEVTEEDLFFVDDVDHPKPR